MNSAIFIALPAAALASAIMFLLPHFSPRRYFFAVTVAPDFPSTPAGRAVLGRYHRHLMGVTVTTAAIVIVLSMAWPAPAIVAAQVIPLFAGFAAYLRSRNAVRCYSAPDSVREAELSTSGDHLPHWIWLALPPFAGPVAAAAWLRSHWEELPVRFPMHWNLAGQPDRWGDKTTRGVYGPLLFEAGLMLMVLLLSLAMFYGSRRGPQRLAILKVEIAAIWLLAYSFTATGLSPALHLPAAAFIVPTVLFLVFVVVWCYRIARNPALPVDQTSDACWRLGSIYYNPQDPAIFVQKRIGFGYTLNFGNHRAWLMMGLFTAGMLGLAFVTLR